MPRWFYIGALAATFASGLCALVFQVIWQKYLSYLVGSEAKSISLVVSVFLLGLACGYAFWGVFSERKSSRAYRFRLYGGIELATGIYAIAFPIGFPYLDQINLLLPNHIASNFLLTLLVLFFPTFCMGASIPLLTKTMATDCAESDLMHAKIYGFNTLGAVAGVFLAAFYGIPHLGLSTSMYVFGCLNCLLALYFILAQPRLTLPLQQSGPHTYKSEGAAHFLQRPTLLYTFIFFIGALTLSLEVLFMRILSQTIGAAFYIFPIVLGVFVLGISLGSLTMRASQVTVRIFLSHILFACFWLLVVFQSIPYWPYWLHCFRALLANIPQTYPIFLAGVAIFLLVILSPLLVVLGRLLPQSFCLLDKTDTDYGKKCGKLYLYNTLGNVFGAIVFGYLLLYWLNIDTILRILLLCLLLSALLFTILQKSKRLGSLALVLLLIGIFMPNWNRLGLLQGLFRYRQASSFTFQGIWQIPDNNRSGTRILSHDDGPNTSVTVFDFPKTENFPWSLSLLVNSKSDGSTAGDYATTANLAILPYLFSNKQKDIRASIIGLGTGITAGLLARLPGIAKLNIIEISPKVVEAAKYFDHFTLDLTKNEKAKFHIMDAFRYYRNHQTKEDLIISEPSNPWVMGTENLFTPRFYDLVKSNLNQDGIFLQWIHTYAMSEAILLTVLKNVTDAFPYVRILALAKHDYGILASRVPLTGKNFSHLWREPLVKRIRISLGLHYPEQIQLATTLQPAELTALLQGNLIREHSTDKPTLAFRSALSMYLGEEAKFHLMIPASIRRWTRYRSENFAALKSLEKKQSRFCDPERYPHQRVYCDPLRNYQNVYRRYKDNKNNWYVRLENYHWLRDLGAIPQDLNFLKNCLQESKSARAPKKQLEFLLREFVLEKEFDLARDHIDTLYKAKQIAEQDVKPLQRTITYLNHEFNIELIKSSLRGL